MVDILSIMGNSGPPWEEKKKMAFWRGRDSRQERLDLIKIARQNPDLINASLTNFFFFRKEEEEYGPKTEYISFFDFFKVSKKTIYNNLQFIILLNCGLILFIKKIFCYMPGTADEFFTLRQNSTFFMLGRMECTLETSSISDYV